MIKQNESELADIDFRLKFPLYFLVLSITIMATSLEPYAQFAWGFQRGIALKLGNTMKMKTEFVFFPSSNSFCLIASHFVVFRLLCFMVCHINFNIRLDLNLVTFD